MTTTDAGPFTDTGPGEPHEQLWPEQVVELLGLKSVASLRATAGRSRALARAGKLTVHDLPVEDGRDLHKVKTSAGVERTVWASWWYRATIEAHLPHRRGRGNPGKAGKADAA